MPVCVADGSDHCWRLPACTLLLRRTQCRRAMTWMHSSHGRIKVLTRCARALRDGVARWWCLPACTLLLLGSSPSTGSCTAKALRPNGSPGWA